MSFDPQNIAILGASGAIGSAFTALLSKNIQKPACLRFLEMVSIALIIV